MKRQGIHLAGAIAALCALVAAAPAAADTKSAHGLDFGVVTIDTPTADDFRAMDRGKVSIDRTLLYWPNLQGAKGRCTAAAGSHCNWAPFDQIMSRAAERGVPLLPYFYGTPSWASHRSGARANRLDPMLTKAGRNGWKHFVAAAVNRYRPGGKFWVEHPELPPDPVRHWQVWNEQNSVNSFRPNPSAKAYSKLLKATSAQVRKAQPGADIILGGMFGTPGGGGARSHTAWGFLGQLYGVRGIKSSFDAVALHPYSKGLHGVKYQLDKLRRAMRHHGDSKTKTWITELGWGSDAKHVNNPLVKTVKGQRKLLVRSFRMLNKHRRSWRIRGVTWFSWRDPIPNPGNCEFCASTGLFTRHFKAKPAWKAFTSFTGGHP
jgi:hypothetical protein